MTQNSHQNGYVTAAPKRSRFASGAVERLPLSDGDWVLVRQELSYGQQRRLAFSGVTGTPAALPDVDGGGVVHVDYAAFELEKLCTWVVDWSFVDDDGVHVVVSREAIEALDPETAREVNAAIDRHTAEQAAKKAGPPGASRPAATSPSAPASAGAGGS